VRIFISYSANDDILSIFNTMSLIPLIKFSSKCGTSEVFRDRIINIVYLRAVFKQLFNDAVSMEGI
jgi:hypothetical protein